MSKESEIKRLLKEIVGTQNYLVRGTVTKITGQTCSVELPSGLEVSDVKLKAQITESDDHYILSPVIGSGVLMLMENGELRNLTVVKMDRVGKFELLQGGLKVVFDGSDNKIRIANENTGLLALFKDLTALLKELKVFTPVGPSGTPLPDTINRIVQLEQRVEQLLK